MQITITARHFELTKAIRTYVEDACEKLTRYFDQIINVHMTLTLENSRNIVDMSLHAARFNLQSQATQMDMYLAIDEAIENMEAQVKKLKDKVTDHQKRSLKKDTDFAYANLYESNQDAKAKKVVRTKRIIAEILSVNEAMDKFAELDEEYFIFRNVESDKINVLVKKNNDHYNLIEP
ncbi:MAG TPA: ribosome-associated translation inhibitor RaiA [Candidatus Cloacimonadota bacterium]|jgi:putative sigma-54 modulation protein|nr:ribosome-associated translation inhibitor RaiA [Candidatus Cloacimonadales bacterium]HPY95720.1 ribosome-associated translation inhibitor RaiA [Candidatus Cloacimonadota bacterium]HQB41555.1 ribosome-associated translation inhibitor RaiA [Candidatus Cloacimonadota bacterium]